MRLEEARGLWVAMSCRGCGVAMGFGRSLINEHNPLCGPCFEKEEPPGSLLEAFDRLRAAGVKSDWEGMTPQQIHDEIEEMRGG